MLMAMSVTGCDPSIGNWKKQLLIPEPGMARQLWRESKLHWVKVN
jgi:hypothetical protein